MEEPNRNPARNATLGDYSHVIPGSTSVGNFFRSKRIILPCTVPKKAMLEHSLWKVNTDGLVKSHKSDGTVKSSRCKARESLGMRRTYQYAAVTKDEAQRSPSALLRAVSMSNGRWTFYEAVNRRFSDTGASCVGR